MPKLHYITFATGVSRVTGIPYAETQRMLVQSIQSKTKYEVVLHTHSLESMMKQPWFHLVQDYPNKFPEQWGRDGYYCAYKVFFTQALMNVIDEGDIIYYTDCSAYFREPFTENIDRLIKVIENVQDGWWGTAGNDFRHSTSSCCDNTQVWGAIWPEGMDRISELLDKSHILASSYMIQKNEKTKKIIDEWAYWFRYELNDRPLCTYHHTVDQSILNVLIYKYNLPVLFCNMHHDFGKNHNSVHRILGGLPNDDLDSLLQWFVYPNELNI